VLKQRMAATKPVPIFTDQKASKLQQQLALLLENYDAFSSDVLDAYGQRAEALRVAGCFNAASKANAEAERARACLAWNSKLFAEFFDEAHFEPGAKSLKGTWLENGIAEEAVSCSASVLQQVLAGLMRDWTDPASNIRDILVEPVAFRVWKGVTAAMKAGMNGDKVANARVWVPGCSTGRLALEVLAGLECTVVASDESVAMLATLAKLARCHRCYIHPSAGCLSPGLQGSEGRVRKDEVFVPSKIRSALQKQEPGAAGKLELELRSLTSHSRTEEEFDAIATLCTLSRVVDLPAAIGTIAKALKSGGVWVNCGPVQAHESSQIVGFTFEELVAIAEAKGLEVTENKILEHVELLPKEMATGSRDVFDVQLLVAKKPTIRSHRLP